MLTGNSNDLIQYDDRGLAFGLVPKQIINEILSPSVDLQTKIQAIEALLNACNNPDSLTLLLDYASSLLKFLGKVLSQNVPKIMYYCLRIINKILEREDLSNRTNFLQILPYLVTGLGHENIKI